MAKRRIDGARILITGASQGIGRALAEAAAARGAKVIAVARSEDQLAELASKVHAQGGSLVTLRADITDADDRRRIFHVNGADRIGFPITRQSQANDLEISRGVRKAIDVLAPSCLMSWLTSCPCASHCVSMPPTMGIITPAASAAT